MSIDPSKFVAVSAGVGAAPPVGDEALIAAAEAGATAGAIAGEAAGLAAGGQAVENRALINGNNVDDQNAPLFRDNLGLGASATQDLADIYLSDTTYASDIQGQDKTMVVYGTAIPGAAYDRGDQFGALRAGIKIYREANAYGNGTTNGDGNQYAMQISMFTPVSPAFTLPANPIVPNPTPENPQLPTRFLQNTQKGPLAIALRHGRGSDGTSTFNDGVGIQSTVSTVTGNLTGRLFGNQINVTLAPASNAYTVGLELEVNHDGTYDQPDLYGLDQKNPLQLLAIGGMVTKLITLGAARGGSVFTGIYGIPGDFRECLAVPIPLVAPYGPDTMNYGGSMIRWGNVYRQTRVGSQIIETIGHVEPRFSEAVVRHINKLGIVDAYDLWQMANSGGTGHLSSNYIITGVAARSAGLDRGSREYRITDAEGLFDANVIAGFGRTDTERYVNMFGPVTSASIVFRDLDQAMTIRRPVNSSMRIESQGETGSAGIQFLSSDPDRIFSYVAGIDIPNAEFVIGEGASILAPTSKGVVVSGKRVGVGGSPMVTSTGAALWVAEGVNPTANAGGIAFYSVAGIPRVILGDGTTATLLYA